jgi:hypothetical protein
MPERVAMRWAELNLTGEYRSVVDEMRIARSPFPGCRAGTHDQNN